jgi:acyl-coenzyme A thioesterase PaaI-like protein
MQLSIGRALVYWGAVQLLPCTRSCFVCGESNPFGLRLRFYTDGQLVRAELTARSEHVGFQGVIHGGIISTLLDEVMAWACATGARHFGYCAELQVRFLAPLRPNARAILTGELVNNRRNRIFEAKSELRLESGPILATGTGKYLPIKESDRNAFIGDLVGDASYWMPKP